MLEGIQQFIANHISLKKATLIAVAVWFLNLLMNWLQTAEGIPDLDITVRAAAIGIVLGLMNWLKHN